MSWAAVLLDLKYLRKEYHKSKDVDADGLLLVESCIHEVKDNQAAVVTSCRLAHNWQVQCAASNVSLHCPQSVDQVVRSPLMRAACDICKTERPFRGWLLSPPELWRADGGGEFEVAAARWRQVVKKLHIFTAASDRRTS